MASLTKIMTTYVILRLLDRFKMDPMLVKVNILESSTTPILGGTSAELLANDKMSVFELMHGMMLPSGNDAAQSLAIYFGNLLQLRESRPSGASADGIDANIYEEDYAEDIDQVPVTVAQSTSGSSGIANESTAEKPPLSKLELKV